jgi:hypothetical protein
MFAMMFGKIANWMIMELFVWPFHIGNALGISTRLELAGYGPAAVTFQAVMLCLLAVGAPIVFCSTRFRRSVKLLYLPLGYGLITLLTNLIPAFFFEQTPLTW